jgi:membrane-associated phospholipid phosphatase
MIKKIFTFVLHSRLENVMAVAVSAILLLLFLGTRTIQKFDLGQLNLIFILLPVGLLSIKVLLGLLLSGSAKEDNDINPTEYLIQTMHPLLKTFQDWFPFFLLSACYYSLYSNLNLQVNPHVMDPLLSKIDEAMLGNQAAILLEPWIHPWATDFFSAIYFSHVLVFPGIALYFYVKKESAIFRTLMMGYLTLMLMGMTSYLIFPATGPEHYFASSFSHGLDGHAISHSVAYIISAGRVAYDCFPSLHVGIPLLVTLYLRRHLKQAFVPALIYVGLMCCATIYLRYHYVIDVIGAFVFAPLAYYFNGLLLRIWPGERIVRGFSNMQTTQSAKT